MRARKHFGIAVSVVSTHLTAGFTRVRLTESQSAIAAAVLQLAVELPFPTLPLPS